MDRPASTQAGLEGGTGFEGELRIRIPSPGHLWVSVRMHPNLDCLLDPQVLLDARADKAMYRAKQHGPNQVIPIGN